jgi:hypothetical protein
LGSEFPRDPNTLYPRCYPLEPRQQANGRYAGHILNVPPVVIRPQAVLIAKINSNGQTHAIGLPNLAQSSQKSRKQVLYFPRLIDSMAASVFAKTCELDSR